MIVVVVEDDWSVDGVDTTTCGRVLITVMIFSLMSRIVTSFFTGS